MTGARASSALSIASSALPDVTRGMAWRTLLLLGASHVVVPFVKHMVGGHAPARGARVRDSIRW